MGTFFASRRNQVIVAVAAVILLVLLLLAAFSLGRGGTAKIGVSPAGSSVTSPSPSASATADASPSPLASATADASPSPSLAPSAAASAAVPGTTSPALTTDNHQMALPATDVVKFNADGCQAWLDPGYDFVDCNVISVRGDTPEGTVWWLIEKSQGPGHGLRVNLLTGTTAENNWHIRLSAVDTDGSKYTAITVKKATVAGDAAPEIVVGFRLTGPAQSLIYDIVELLPAQVLEVAATRVLSGGGSANVEASDIVDYQPEPDPNTPSYFLRSVIGFSGGAFRVTDSSHAPERGPGNLAPPP